MRVFERFIANECPPENGSVLWINVSEDPITLNMKVGDKWVVMGAFYDAESLKKVLEILGEFEDPNNTVALILEQVQAALEEASYQEILDMFIENEE